MKKKTGLTLGLALALGGCSSQLLEWQPTTDELPAGLTVDFSVAPGEVRAHEPFSATLRIRNVSADTVRMVTAHGCLVLPHVYREGTRLPFRGTALGCTAAITTHTFAPGAERNITWQLEAELYAQDAGDRDGAPAPAGDYAVVAEFDRYEPGEPQKPSVIRPLRVR